MSPPFHPRPDCPAVYERDGVLLDLNLVPVTFPCGAFPGCGRPNCRWGREGRPSARPGCSHEAALARPKRHWRLGGTAINLVSRYWMGSQIGCGRGAHETAQLVIELTRVADETGDI